LHRYMSAAGYRPPIVVQSEEKLEA